MIAAYNSLMISIEDLYLLSKPCDLSLLEVVYEWITNKL